MGRPKKRTQPVRRRADSFAAFLDSVLLPYAATHKGTPSTFAIALSPIMGRALTRQEVWQALHDNCYTKKTQSPVPGLSIPEERSMHLRELSQIWTRPDQIVFIDEKKFRRSEVLERFQKYGYSARGTRLPFRLTAGPSAILPPSFEVVGALSVVDPRPLQDGRIGTVGLCSFSLVEGKLSIEDILHWFSNNLAPRLNAFPGPRSIVVLDNMPQHRSNQRLLRAICDRHGALLVWNPPNSPDLNPIEKLWDVVKSSASRRHVELMAGLSGPPRAFTFGDLIECLSRSRLSVRAYDDIFERDEF